MIFATVGTQLPFPRLIDALDGIAQRRSLEIFAQTADPSARPQHLHACPFLPPRAYGQKISSCSTIVAHAGIGTVLEAKRARKPLIIFPRRAQLGEHRNEHQLATAKFLSTMPGIYVAQDETELDHLLCGTLVPASPDVGEGAERLIAFLKQQLGAWAKTP